MFVVETDEISAPRASDNHPAVMFSGPIGIGGLTLTAMASPARIDRDVFDDS
jgi:hypothetical protein